MSTAPKKIGLFIVMTYAPSWITVFLLFELGGWTSTSAITLIAMGYMFFPLFGAIVTQKFFKAPIQHPLGISWDFNYWFLLGWLLPFPVIFMTLGLSLVLPGVTYAPQLAGFSLIIQIISAALVAGPTLNAFFAFGEELGWRGFLQNELSHIGFWKSSGLIGLIWGLWHAPLILYGYNYPQYPLIGIGWMVIFTLLLSPIFGYIRLKADSVVAVAILHGTINAVAGLTIVLTAGGNPLTVGITGATGFAVLFLVNIGLLIYDQVRSTPSINEVLADRM